MGGELAAPLAAHDCEMAAGWRRRLLTDDGYETALVALNARWNSSRFLQGNNARERERESESDKDSLFCSLFGSSAGLGRGWSPRSGRVSVDGPHTRQTLSQGTMPPKVRFTVGVSLASRSVSGPGRGARAPAVGAGAGGSWLLDACGAVRCGAVRCWAVIM